LGLGQAGIGATFLLAAALGVVARPWVGRWADKRGLLASLRIVVMWSMLVTIAMPWLHEAWAAAAGVVCAVTLYGVLSSPAMAFLAEAYDEAGLTPVLGFALMGFNLGLGFFIGSAVAGELAAVAGDSAAYALAAAMCAATLVVLSLWRQPRGSLDLGEASTPSRS
jgi:MFS family permease